jgi:DNA-binding CsgD family transcriptional regulator
MQPAHHRWPGGRCQWAQGAKSHGGELSRPSPPGGHPFTATLPAEGWCRLATDAINRGKYLLAVEYLGLVRRLAGPPWPLIRTDFAVTKMVLDWHTGQWSALAADIACTSESAPPGRSSWGVALAVLAGRLALAQGDLVGAEALLREALRPGPVDAAADFRPQAAGALARLLISRGDEAEAMALVHRELSGVRSRGAWWGAVELAPVITQLLGRHDHVRAASFFKEVAAGTAHHTLPLSGAVLADCRGRLAEARGDEAGAAEHYRVAAERYTALPRPYDAALALEGVGRCLYAVGRSGAPELGKAVGTFDAIGARWDASRCRALMRGQGLFLGGRCGRHGYGPGLSPRVRDVVQLAALGRTNREIAEALHLSRRTVEEYVSKALRKLGVASRRDFPRYAAG